MDTELKCNHLACRRVLIDRAVVTTCSHIFCVECANELFTAAQLCPACETQLTEPDDVVICSLHPSNDYKTSILSGLSPSIILEICARAISFWQYQLHQEQAFQQAVLKNLNERNAQLQKQVENVVREANSEIKILQTKVTSLEKDLEMERRKTRELHDAARERDKEYQRLKTHYDKLKRKTILAPNVIGNDVALGSISVPQQTNDRLRQFGQFRTNDTFGPSAASGLPISAVVGGMEANGIQRTPIRAVGGPMDSRLTSHRRQRLLGLQRVDNRSFSKPVAAGGNVSERSASVDEVENLLTQPSHNRDFARPNHQAFSATPRRSGFDQGHTHLNLSGKRGFRPAAVPR